jgi:protein-tyrosine phosphatase
VIGKVKAFQRIAAAKMTHPTIKIDTSVQTTKRGLPENDDAGLDVLGGEQDNPRLEAGNTEDVPPFLCQSVSGGCMKSLSEEKTELPARGM